MGNMAWALDVIEDLKGALDKRVHKKAHKHLTKAGVAIAKTAADAPIKPVQPDIVVPVQGRGGKSRK